jgi:hypothetical protein
VGDGEVTLARDPAGQWSLAAAGRVLYTRPAAAAAAAAVDLGGSLPRACLRLPTRARENSADARAQTAW